MEKVETYLEKKDFIKLLSVWEHLEQYNNLLKQITDGAGFDPAPNGISCIPDILFSASRYKNKTQEEFDKLWDAFNAILDNEVYTVEEKYELLQKPTILNVS